MLNVRQNRVKGNTAGLSVLTFNPPFGYVQHTITNTSEKLYAACVIYKRTVRTTLREMAQ